MAAPARQSSAVTTVSSTTNSTSFPSIGLATGTGGRHVVYVTSAATGDLTAPSDWVKVDQLTNGSNLSIAVFWSFTATSLTITSATSTQFSAVAIRDYDNTAIYMTPAAAFGASTNPNPPAIDMIATKDHRFEAVTAQRGTGVPTAAPSGYSGLTTIAGGGANGAGLAVASKTTTASRNEDPGTFTATSATWLAVTVGFYSYTADRLAYWKALLQNPTKNPVLLGVGTSLTAGALNTGAGSNTMGSNAFATSRPAVWASTLTALPAAVWMIGIGGIPSATNTSVAAYNNRFSAGASFTTTDQADLPTIGRGAWLLSTSGQKISLVIPQTFNRVRVRVFARPDAVIYTVDVNGGTAQSITAMNGALAYTEQTFNLSGTSGDVVNINGTGSPGAIVSIDAWHTSTYQVQVFGAGWYGGSSADIANAGAVYNSLYGVFASNADLVIIEPNANDGPSGANLTTKQSKDNVRSLILAGMSGASGQANVMYPMFPYSSSANETQEDGVAAILQGVCDELGAYFFNTHLQPGWTSKAASNAAGYSNNTDVHLFAAGYADWGARERAVFDPGPPAQNLTASLLTNTSTLYAPTVTASKTLSPALLVNAQTFYAPTVTPGPVSLSPGLLNNASTVYPPTVTPAPVSLSAPLLTNISALYSPTVSTGGLTLSPPLLTNGNTLYAPTVTPGAVTLSPPLYSNANALYAPTVTPGSVSLSPGLLTNTSTLYAPVVSQGGITLAPPLLANTNTLFSPTVTQAAGGQSLSPPRLDNVNGFFAPSVTPGPVTLSPSRLTNVSTLYPPTVIQPGAAQLLQPGLLQNTSVLFAPAVANDNAPGTYPLAIEGGGTVVLDILTGTATVVGGTITFTGRVVAGALRGRP